MKVRTESVTTSEQYLCTRRSSWNLNYINLTVWIFNHVTAICQYAALKTARARGRAAEKRRDLCPDTHYGDDLFRTFHWHLPICAVIPQKAHTQLLKWKCRRSPERSIMQNHNKGTKHVFWWMLVNYITVLISKYCISCYRRIFKLIFEHLEPFELKTSSTSKCYGKTGLRSKCFFPTLE